MRTPDRLFYKVLQLVNENTSMKKEILMAKKKGKKSKKSKKGKKGKKKK
jgi:hypothetical protein